jgi:TrpR-related protein YerC/YecD
MTLDGSRDTWRTPEVEDLCRAFQCLDTTDEIGAFLRDLCTAAELEAMAHRLAAARLLDRGLPYHQVAERVGGSTTTVTRVAQWLRRGEGGYRIVLDRTAPPEPGVSP